MTQEVHPLVELKQHSIWQEGQQPEPCVVVIFGATGDLTQRKLLPTLAHLAHDHPLPEGFSIVAFARRPMTDLQWRAMAMESVNKYLPEGDKLDEKAQQAFSQKLYYCQSDFNDREGYQKLADLLDRLDEEQRTEGNRLFYLAAPPTTDSEIIHQLGGAGLARQQRNNGDEESWTRIVIEKPFGRDLASAQKLNRELGRVFRENQIYRIDHYLGKETVQNLLAFRFSNGIFEPLWNKNQIDHIQVTVTETVGVEGRGGYYDRTGVMRDMIQNHMFQMLAYLCMEPPASFRADAIRNEKSKLLDAVRVIKPEEVPQYAVRGQYGPGKAFDGKAVPGYRAEPDV